MQNCLGMYLENNLIKYAKVSKDKEILKVETFGLEFFDDIGKAIYKIIEETNSYNTSISINLANEKYLYYDVFALLSKEDIKKTIQTEFESYCEEKKYNSKAFETRYALTKNIEEKDKIKAIQVIINKIDLEKQKGYFEKNNLTGILPIGTSIASIVKAGKDENILIANMEDKTTITSVYDKQIYNVETLDLGSQEVLDKINKLENSYKKAYEICKDTTIYTSNLIEDTKEQPYLENIIPTLYQIGQAIKDRVNNSPVKISTVYLTGTLAMVNNVDLYFQEFLATCDCKILRPNIVEENMTNVNIKDYIEVNSAISLAMQALGEGIQSLNFKKVSVKDKLSELSNLEIGKGGKKKKVKEKKKINFSLAGALDKVEVNLIRAGGAIILITIIFTIFSILLTNQMKKKEQEIDGLISKENAEIAKIKKDTSSLDAKNSKYTSLIGELKAINDKISNIAERKNSVPNLLNQIMYIIPETVQLTSIENTEEKKIVIIAQADDYDQLGYFIAKIKVEEILKNTISSSGQKSGNIVTVKIEGDLP